MAVASSDPVVQKSVTVNATAAQAFTVFTAGIDAWWPKSHHIGKSPLAQSVIESRVGGLCYGRSEDGTVCPWGQVLVWEPPHRLVFAWQITPDWTYEPDLSRASEVEVRFSEAGPRHTRVDLEHRHFSRHGAGADGMRAAVDAPNGWSGLLQLYAMRSEAGTADGAAAAPLSFIFATDSALVVKAFEGLDDQQLWQRPTASNNPFLWVVGHIVQVRTLTLGLLGVHVDTGWGARFARGAALADRSAYPEAADILRVHEEVAQRLATRLRDLTAEELAREATVGPTPPGVKTLGEQIGFLALHDAYHVGQLGYIRRLLGLPGLVG